MESKESAAVQMIICCLWCPTASLAIQQSGFCAMRPSHAESGKIPNVEKLACKNNYFLQLFLYYYMTNEE